MMIAIEVCYMNEEFWKRLVQAYIHPHIEGAVSDLKKLRKDVESSEVKREEKDRMLTIIDDILKSDNIMSTLKHYTENEITKFIGGDVCY
ncbi:MAG: hypothetical protein ACLFVI_03045 [Archaeoglobaceae archaeon]